MIPTNDYSLSLVFGKKGCGKSSTIARLARDCAKHKRHCYTTVELDLSKFKKVDTSFIHFFSGEDYGYFRPEEESLFLIDEVNTIWDNRDWKKFSRVTQAFFRYQRHFRCTTITFSQSYDVDSKIRSLTDYLWIMKKYFGVFSVMTKIHKYIAITEPNPDTGTSDIVEAYEKCHWWSILDHDYTFLPLYRGYFDSFCTYPLPSYKEFYAKKLSKSEAS